MLNINNYSRSALEQGKYKDLVGCLKSVEELETLGTIVCKHKDDELYTQDNSLSMRLNDEPVIYVRDKSVRDKRYVLNAAQNLILKDMKHVLNGRKFGIWSRVEVLNEINCRLKEKQPGYTNPQYEDWLGRRLSSFVERKQEVKETADVSESSE
ncbi:MAG: hypothetical protein V1839_04170 [archaeon]